MEKRNLTGLVFEGIARSGKTTTLRQLSTHPAWLGKPFLTSVILSEHQTLRVLENGVANRKLSASDHHSLLDAHVTYVEQIGSRLDGSDWLVRDREAQKVVFLFERFHLSHLYHYPYLTWQDFADIDRRLGRLHATLCLFTIDPNDIQSRTINDYRAAGWQTYLQSIGSTDNAIRDYFIRKQNELTVLAKRTSMPVLWIDSSKLSPDKIVSKLLHTLALSDA